MDGYIKKRGIATLVRRDPVTGKRVPVPGVDPINPRKLPYEVMVRETARLAQEVEALKARWDALSDRHGAEGRALIRRYKHVAAQVRELTGQEPMPIYANW